MPVPVVIPLLLCMRAGPGRVVAELRNVWALGVFGSFLGPWESFLGAFGG